ncbi:MAG TPA: hypothetical protein VGX97_09380 [bacterium]|nr:hypothetical protein [bacterium]
MRQRILLVLVVLAAIIPLAAGHPWRPAVGASPVIPGVALADISVGAPIGEVLNRFGTPSVVRLTGGNGLLGYGFDRYGITVYAHGDIVQAVASTNSVLGGVNGIALGTPLSEVVRTLGQVYSRGVVEGYPGVVYSGAGVAFGIDHDAVAAILVFRPASAAPGQPTSPGSPAGPVTSQGATAPAAGPAPVPGPAGAQGPADPASSVVVANAATTGSGGLPDVSRLRAYTADTHFLSLSGYLRYLVHDTSKTWLSAQDTDRLMREAGSATIR